MSEQLNNPEQHKPKELFDDCIDCEEKIKLDNSNSFVVMFNKEPRFNFLNICCPNCETAYRQFLAEDSGTLEQAIQLGIDVNPTLTHKDGLKLTMGGDYADPKTVELWEQCVGFERVPSYELTPRHEQEIEKFIRDIGRVTANIPDVFWDEMNAEKLDKPYPQRWI